MFTHGKGNVKLFSVKAKQNKFKALNFTSGM